MNFSQRHNAPEIMDDLSCKGAVLDQTLRELDTINRLLGGNTITLDGIEYLYKKHNHKEPITILDLGCGSGEMLVLIAKWARKKGYNVQLTGIDANPYIVDYAKKHCQDFPEITIAQADIFDDATFDKSNYHIITATLFLHHFTDEQLITFLKKHKHKAHWGWVINDLHRHWLAYWSIKLLTRLFSRSEMVKNDGPLSVARAFRKDDLEYIFAQANIKLYEVHWKWAFRWGIVFRS